MEPQITLLETCSALPLGEDNAVPDWVMLLPAGVSRGVDGRGPYNNDQPDAVVANSMQDGRPLPFDYNHQTVFAALQGQNSPASGWINKLENRDGAIWGQVEWTPKGHAALADKEYRFVSPAFKHDHKTGRVQKLVSSALVNSPNLRELPAIHAQLNALFPKTGDAKPMDEELRARLVAAYGLEANASMETIVAHAEKIRAAASGTLTTGAPDPAKYVPMAAFTELQTEVGVLRKAAASAHATGLVDAAATAGKLTPAMREWGLDYASTNPAGFEAWAAAAPAIVAPGTDTRLDGKDVLSTHASGLTPKELEVAANLGVSPEAYAATKKKAA